MLRGLVIFWFPYWKPLFFISAPFFQFYAIICGERNPKSKPKEMDRFVYEMHRLFSNCCELQTGSFNQNVPSPGIKHWKIEFSLPEYWSIFVKRKSLRYCNILSTQIINKVQISCGLIIHVSQNLREKDWFALCDGLLS